MTPEPIGAEGAADAADSDFELFDEEGALSRAFLLQRGFCCENGCKNCPYGFDKNDGEKESQ